MKRAYYDEKPSKYEAVGNGSYLYRWDIREEVATNGMTSSGEVQQEEGQEGRVQYSCCEVVVWAPVSSNAILQAVLGAKFPNNREQKYINEYNGVSLGIYAGEESDKKVEAYKSFLNERDALKTQVDADCAELGIK